MFSKKENRETGEVILQSEISVFPILEARALRSLDRVYNLDLPEIKIVNKIPSGFGRLDAACHVHDILVLQIGKHRFFAKSENVMLRLDCGYVYDYRNFYWFTESVFEILGAAVPVKTFSFPEEPELEDITFYRADIFRFMNQIREIKDDTPPSSIQDPKLRSLFLLYLSKKEKIMKQDKEYYENVFTHYGRDIINEILSSIVGRLIGVRVPRNYLGIKTDIQEPAYNGGKPEKKIIRYILSKSINKEGKLLSLDQVLGDIFREKQNDHDMKSFLAKEWVEANPLNVDFFENTKGDEIASMIIHNFPHFRDIIRSNFFDVILKAAADRKMQEFLLPEGKNGHIFTVDYGEILFPELEFDADDPHYLSKRKAHLDALASYLERIAGLPEGNVYKRTVGNTLGKYLCLSERFFREIIKRIPEKFFKYGWDEKRFCYQPKTLVDFFIAQRDFLIRWLVGHKSAKTGDFYEKINSIFN